MPAVALAAASDRKLKAGESLFRQGGKTVGLYEVLSGCVRLVRIDRWGHEAVLHVAGPGETLAEASLFSAQRLYPKRELLAALEDNPKAMKAFSRTLAHLEMSLRTRIEQRNIRSAGDRVRHFLALNVGADGRTVELRGTLKDLAAEVGLTHESLYRTLAELERSGHIRRKGREITLSKPYD
jgi:CRP/FNR family transcriptional regulator, dissimilatory nitrate respiration regulator